MIGFKARKGLPNDLSFLPIFSDSLNQSGFVNSTDIKPNVSCLTKMEPTVARIRKNSKPSFKQVPKSNPAPFLEENLFQQVLALERKRAERSGNTSLLVKIDIRHSAGTEKDIIAERIDSLLGSLIRETDIKGWYEPGSVIGVIFTELGESELIEAEGKILKKVREELKQISDEQQPVVIGISSEYLSPLLRGPEMDMVT